jgi:hypothetical protein
MTRVYRLHGLPASIVSHRDPVFTSTFWQQLFKLIGTELKLSSSYLSQTDGQTKRVNQCLETFLRCFVSACPKKRKDWLPAAEFCYNTSMRSALRCSPFEAKPRTLGITLHDVVPDNLSSWLHERSIMQEFLHQHLVRAFPLRLLGDKQVLQRPGVSGMPKCWTSNRKEDIVTEGRERRIRCKNPRVCGPEWM